MAVVHIVPHVDETITHVDIEFTNNIYGAWTSLLTNDSIANYPKRISDNRITDLTYLRIRVKDTQGNYSDWSEEYRPFATNNPGMDSRLCWVYGRLRDILTQEPLNGVKIRFQQTGGSATGGAPIVRDVTSEADDYGFIAAYLTPGIQYLTQCPEAGIRKTITVPSSVNATLVTL